MGESDTINIHIHNHSIFWLDTEMYFVTKRRRHGFTGTELILTTLLAVQVTIFTLDDLFFLKRQLKLRSKRHIGNYNIDDIRIFFVSQ